MKKGRSLENGNMNQIYAAKTNHISLSFDAISENEAFARMTAAMFMAQLNPTLDDVEDVKTAVSEAVTNAIIHGYEMG